MVGWVNDGETQTGIECMFNMILEDGTRSDNDMAYNGKVRQRYDYFLPKNKRITKVTINHFGCIRGFRFHLSDGSNWDIGYVELDLRGVTVDIPDNEVIVGFKAKSTPACQAYYVEWQFITAR